MIVDRREYFVVVVIAVIGRPEQRQCAHRPNTAESGVVVDGSDVTGKLPECVTGPTQAGLVKATQPGHAQRLRLSRYCHIQAGLLHPPPDLATNVHVRLQRFSFQYSWK